MVMAARASAISLVTLLAAAALACGGDEPTPEPLPPPTGDLLADVGPGFCFEPCRSYELHSDGEGLVELRGYGSDGREPDLFVGLALADLDPETTAQLEQLLAEARATVEAGPLEPGDSPSCHFTDAPRVRLWLDPEASEDEDGIRYDWMCPPLGLEALDELVIDIIEALADCRASEHVSPRIGCEPLNPWLEL